MTQENNSFDDFLQRKVEDAEFTFKEDYWEKMQQVLDDDEKDKKKPFWWRGIYVFVAALIVGAGALLFSNTNNNSKDKNTTQFVQVGATINTVSEKNTEEKSIEKLNDATLNNDALLAKETSKEKDEQYTQGNVNPAQTNSSKQVEKVEAIATDNNTNSTLNSKKSISENKKISKNKKKKKETNTASENENIVETGKDNMIEKQEVENKTPALFAKQKKTKNKKEQVAIAKNANSRISTYDAKQTTNKQSENKSAAQQITMINGRKMNAIDSTTVAIKRRNGEAYNPRYVAGLDAYISEHVDSISIITFTPVKEKGNENLQAKTENNVAQQDSNITKNKKPISYFAMIGMNANKGFKSDISNPILWGVSPMVSFGVEKIIAPKLTISTQIGFTYFNALNVNYQVANYTYSFGLDSSIFSVDYKKMMQLYLPISVQYQLAKKHYITGGLGASYSFALSSMVKENQQTTATQSYSYRSGFKPLDMFVQAGYMYNVSNSFSLFGCWQQGLTDVTDNTYFTNSISTKQSKLSLGIKYNFKKNGKHATKK